MAGIGLDFNRFPMFFKAGWVDFVAVLEFLLERGDLPIDQWKQSITTVPVYGGIDLFNFFTSREEGEKAYEPPFEVLRELGR